MCGALYLTIAEWTNPSIFLFKHRSGVKPPPRSTPLLFLAKEIKRKRHEVRGVSTRAGGDYSLSALLLFTPLVKTSVALKGFTAVVV